MNTNKRYLVRKNSSDSIEEIYIIYKTEKHYYLRFHYPNNKIKPYYYQWISRYDFDDNYGKYYILEELDEKIFRLEKLKRILKDG